MKNHKQLVCGILIGAVATLSITALAEYIINPNPYPVKVNGQTVQIEGYNINDSTYFKLRDISSVIDGINVDFKDGAVTIDTAEPSKALEPTSTPVPLAEIPPAATEVNPAILALYKHYVPEDGLTSDGISYKIIEGAKYIAQEDIKLVYDLKERGYKFGLNEVAGSKLAIYDKNGKIVDNIPIAPNDDSAYIEYTYYETVLRVWLQEHCK